MNPLLNVTMVGDEALLVRIQRWPTAVHDMLLRKVTALSLRLQTHVKSDKLSGQVLNRKTGALSRSIVQQVIDQGLMIIGRVFSSGDVKYAAIHEFGGKTRAHDILPKKADALSFMIGGQRIFARVVHHPGSVMPERSYMRSSLTDMAEEITVGLKQAVIDGLMVGQREAT